MLKDSNGLHLLMHALDSKFARLNFPGCSAGRRAVLLCGPTDLVV